MRNREANTFDRRSENGIVPTSQRITQANDRITWEKPRKRITRNPTEKERERESHETIMEAAVEEELKKTLSRNCAIKLCFGAKLLLYL